MLSIMSKVRKVKYVELRFIFKFCFSCVVSGSGIPIIKGELSSNVRKQRIQLGKKKCVCIVIADALLDKIFWFGCRKS